MLSSFSLWLSVASCYTRQLLLVAQRRLLLCSAASLGGSAVPYCSARLLLFVAQLFPIVMLGCLLWWLSCSLLLRSAASLGGSAVPYCYARLLLLVAQLFLPLCLAAGSLTHHIEEKRWFLDVVHHAMYVQSYIIFRNYSLWRMNFFAKNI